MARLKTPGTGTELPIFAPFVLRSCPANAPLTSTISIKENTVHTKRQHVTIKLPCNLPSALLCDGKDQISNPMATPNKVSKAGANAVASSTGPVDEKESDDVNEGLEKFQTTSGSHNRREDRLPDPPDDTEKQCDIDTEDVESVATIHEQDDHEHEGEPERDLERAQTSASIGPIHSVFSKRKRNFIVFMAAIAGFFSPLSASIYFPALNAISADLKVSNSIVNLSLTTYMIFQGLAPTFFGSLADAAGRRPVYIIGFTIYIAANLGLALQDSFAALLILRCLQSSGSSSTIALASGVAADVASSAERGMYMGWVTSGALVGPAIGPVLGGILSEFLGWRWIFWFLVILAGAFMIPLVIAFPETSRNVVGDGSVPPQGWNKTVLNVIDDYRQNKRRPPLERTTSNQSRHSARSALANKRQKKSMNPLATFGVVLQKDIGLLLFFNSLVYTAFYDVIASMPYIFAQTYGFNDLQIGLCFIPYGVGAFIAPLMNGRLLDWNFRRIANRYSIPIKKGRTMELHNFPLEEARIWVAVPLLLFGDVCLLCYGWAMEKNANLAAPLVLQFLMGVSMTAGYNVISVMLVDYYPTSPATATAANNLCRCLMGAGGTAVIIYMIEAMGRGWCFTLIAGVIVVTMPILLLLLKKGPQWREERRVRLAAAEGEGQPVDGKG